MYAYLKQVFHWDFNVRTTNISPLDPGINSTVKQS